MYSKLVGIMYALNVLVSAIFTLLTPVGILFLIAWLLNTKAGVGNYIYAVLLIVGVLVGLVSMIRFLIKASETLERIEKEHGKSEKK